MRTRPGRRDQLDEELHHEMKTIGARVHARQEERWRRSRPPRWGRDGTRGRADAFARRPRRHPTPRTRRPPPFDWGNYEDPALEDVGEPSTAVLPDQRVLHTARNGDVRLTDPATGVTRVVNTLDVYANSEDGLQGIALAPDFAESNQVYLVYAPRGARTATA